MRKEFVSELFHCAREDPSIFLIVGDLGFGVIEEFQRELPDQFLNSGIAEQSMMSLAAGLASRGFRPFVYSIGNFPTLRCLEQIRNDVAYHALPVSIVAVGAGLTYGHLGYSHHAIEDLSIMRAIPGMRVLSPGSGQEARQSVRSALISSTPTYVRLGKGRTGGEKEPEPGSAYDISRPKRLRAGDDLIVLATGTIVDECLQAAEVLSGSGISVEVWSVPTVCPIELDWMRGLRRDLPLVSVEENLLPGGFGSAVLECLSDMQLNRNLTRIGLKPELIRRVGSESFLRALHGIDAPNLQRLFVSLAGSSANETSAKD